MAKLIMLKGLPGSGKSTWAREYVLSRQAGEVIRVNKDDLRAMMNGDRYTKSTEAIVIAARDAIVSAALSKGKDVVVDDTNFNKHHQVTLKRLANIFFAEFEIQEFILSIKECIRRDALRLRPVGEKVIRDMAKQYGVVDVDWRCV